MAEALEQKRLALREQERKRLEGARLLMETRVADALAGRMVTLNVGGRTHACSSHSLRRFPESLLGLLGARVVADQGPVFLDRDGDVYVLVLYFLRTGKVPAQLSVREWHSLLLEAEFLQLPELVQALCAPTALNALDISALDLSVACLNLPGRDPRRCAPGGGQLGQRHHPQSEPEPYQPHPRQPHPRT